MLDRLSFGFGRALPLVLQTEATECGLACLCMVAGYHGYRTDLSGLRQRFSVSLKGTTLSTLIRIAHQLELSTRPLKLDMEHLGQLKLPCILHWDFNHFVVLKAVGSRTVEVYDPALGIRKYALAEVSKHFTGVALELWPNPGFKPVEQKHRVRLRGLVGRVSGLYRSFGQILLLALALEVFALAAPFYLQWVIDNVLVSADRDLLTTLALGFGLLMFMQQAVGLVRGWVMMYMATNLNVQWRANVFAHLLRLPVGYFEKRHLGDVVSRFGSIDTIQRTLTTSFLEAILDGLMTAVTLVLMFVYSRQLAWIAVGAMALYGVGRWVWFGDMGTVLSGGQKQRILLARALYKKPKILFLDEATSHLDIEREHLVNAAVKALQMTRVIVAHRPETIGTADRAVVLAGGKVAQEFAGPKLRPVHDVAAVAA
jgi:ATP-binding cassette subfamily B protein RaxB